MNFSRTARIIATLDCDRACDYCVNSQQGILEQARPLTNLLDLKGYRTICITGGEPMLYPVSLIRLIVNVARVDPRIKVYLSASNYKDIDSMITIMRSIDGIHYTIHAGETELDITKFHALQDLIRYQCLNEYKTCRLTIMNGMSSTLYLSPWVWSNIEMLAPDPACRILENEDLYLLSSELWA